MRTALTEKKPVVVLGLVTALCILGDSMLYIVLPIYWREGGIASLWEVGLILSVNRWIRLPIHPLVGRMYRKISLRAGIFLAVALGSLTTVGYGFADGLPAWLLLRSLWGVAWSLLRIGGYYAIIRAANGKNRGEMTGTYNGLYRLGSLIGMAAGGLLGPWIGLRNTSLLFGGLSLIGILLLLSFPSETISGGEAETKKEKPARHPLGWGTVFPVLFSVFWVALVFQGILPSTLSAFILRFGETVTLMGFTLAATAWSGILQGARWVWEPFLAGRIGRWSDGTAGRIPLFVASLILSAAGLSVMLIFSAFPLWTAATLLVLLTGTSLTTLSDSLAADEAVRTRNDSLLPLTALAQDLGAAAGPALAYLLLESGADLWRVYAIAAAGFAVMAWFWHRSQSSGRAEKKERAGGADSAFSAGVVRVNETIRREERKK